MPIAIRTHNRQIKKVLRTLGLPNCNNEANLLSRDK